MPRRSPLQLVRLRNVAGVRCRFVYDNVLRDITVCPFDEDLAGATAEGLLRFWASIRVWARAVAAKSPDWRINGEYPDR